MQLCVGADGQSRRGFSGNDFTFSQLLQNFIWLCLVQKAMWLGEELAD